MAPGTSPSIVGSVATTESNPPVTYDGYTIAFQANSGALWYIQDIGGFSTVNTGLGMLPGTSPGTGAFN
jgi:hypothetical protein